MKFDQRNVGNTSLKVSTLGLGTASLAGNMDAVDESAARATIPHAIGTGLTLVDTAPFYGFGKAEHLTGDGIRAHRENVVLSTKVGRLLAPQIGPYARPHSWHAPFPFVDVYDYTYDGIMRSYADSLQRLATNRIDILLVHDIGPETQGDNAPKCWDELTTSGYRALTELKASGAVKAIGLGVNEWEVLMQAFELGDWDVFLLAGRYTLLEQTSLSPFLETCLKRSASVICGGPFNSGLLVGGTTYNYEPAPQHLLDKVASIRTVCKTHRVSLPAAALQFPLAHEAICAVLPGPRTIAEFDQIAGWWGEEIPGQFWTDLAEAGLVTSGTPLPNGATA